MIAVRTKSLEQRAVEWRTRALGNEFPDSPPAPIVAPDLSTITDPLEYAIKLAEIALGDRVSIVIKNGRGDKPEFQLYLETKTGPPTISYRKQGNRYFTHEVRTLQAGFVIGASSPVDFAKAVHSYVSDLLKLRFPKEWMYPAPDRKLLGAATVRNLESHGQIFIDVDDIPGPNASRAITIEDAMEGGYARVLETIEAAADTGHLVTLEFHDDETDVLQLLYVEPQDTAMKIKHMRDENGVSYWSVDLGNWAAKKLADIEIDPDDHQFWIGETPVPFEFIFRELKVACKPTDMEGDVMKAVRAELINHFNFAMTSKTLLGDDNDPVGFRVVASIEVFKGQYGVTTSEFLVPSHVNIALTARVPTVDLVDKLRDALTDKEPIRIRTNNGNIVISGGDYFIGPTIGDGANLASALHASITNIERILEKTNAFAQQLERGLDRGLEIDEDDLDDPENWNM